MYNSFFSEKFRAFLAKGARISEFDDTSLTALGGQSVQSLGWLLENPQMTPKTAGLLLSRCFAQKPATKGLGELVARSTAKSGVLPLENIKEILNNICPKLKQEIETRRGRMYGYQPDTSASENLDVMARVFVLDGRIPEDLLVALYEAMVGAHAVKAGILFHTNMSVSTRNTLIEANKSDSYHVLWQAIRLKLDVPTAYLADLANRKIVDHQLIELMDHPNANQEIWRRAIGMTGRDVRAALARSPLAAEPEVRKELLGSSAADVMEGLLNTATAEEWPALYYRLLRKDSERALNYMADHPIPKGARIPGGWIKSFMMSSDNKTRELAVKCLAKCQGGYEGASAPPPDRAPVLRRPKPAQ